MLAASTHENVATETLLGQLHAQGQAARLQLFLVDRGVTTRAARSLSEWAALEVRRVGHDKGRHEFVPLAYAWRVEVAHGTCCAASGWLQVAFLVQCSMPWPPSSGCTIWIVRRSPRDYTRSIVSRSWYPGRDRPAAGNTPHNYSNEARSRPAAISFIT